MKLISLIENGALCERQISANFDGIQRTVIERSQSIADNNFSRISVADLRLLYNLYDEQVFAGGISEALGDCSINFQLSRRMTSSAGMTVRTRHPQAKAADYVIKIAISMLFDSFTDDSHRAIKCCGIECHNRLSALQLTMEHELTHLIELLLWDHSSCNQQRFHSITQRFFGHRKNTHQLITAREKAVVEYGIKPGARVRFDYQGEYFTGTVNRIVKRATVLVDDPDGQRYSDGNTYSKYYVPVEQLEVLSADVLDA